MENCLKTGLSWRRMDLDQSPHQLLPVDREVSLTAATPCSEETLGGRQAMHVTEATFNLTPVSNTFSYLQVLFYVNATVRELPSYY